MLNPRTLNMIVLPIFWIGCWVVLSMAALWGRAPLPGEDLQILAVAWDMWRGGSMLVPHLNGAPLGDTYPLLAWIINAGWALFGVNEWWPALISPAFGLASLFLSAALCRALWPGWSGLGALSATVLLGTIGWSAFAMMAGSAIVLGVLVLLALYGAVLTWYTGRWSGVAIYGLAGGAAMLGVGPVALVYIAPVVLLAPVWGRALDDGGDSASAGKAASDDTIPGGWRFWYLQVLAGLLLALGIFAAWAIPASLEAGPAYARALLWDGTLNRALTAFGPAQDGWTWWSGFILFGGLLVPWIIWAPAWRSLAGTWDLLRDGGARFCLSAIVPVLVLLVLFPSRDLAVFVPLAPALAMLIGFLLYRYASKAATPKDDTGLLARAEAAPAVLVALIGFLLIVVPLSGALYDAPWWALRLAGGWGAVLVAIGAITLYDTPRPMVLRVIVTTVMSCALIAVGHLAARPLVAEHFDLRPAAAHVQALRQQGIALAFVGRYGGEFDFLARLERPVDVIDRDDPIGATAWASANPGAEIAVYARELVSGGKPSAIFKHANGYLVFWPSDTIAEYPAMLMGPESPDS